MDILPEAPVRRRWSRSICLLCVAVAGSLLSVSPGGITSSFTPAVAEAAEPEVTPTVTPSPDPTQEPEPPPPPPPPPVYPDLPQGSGSGRRVVYSNSQQRVWLVESDGNVAGSWLISGRKGVPRPGHYRVFSKSRHARAGGGVRMEYMVRFARGRRLAIGFHSIPVNRRGVPLQSEADLGQYRSHGCVRQRMTDAIQLWNFAGLGTPVVVLG